MPHQPTIPEIRLDHISTCLIITGSSLQLLVDTVKISGLEAILNTTDSLTIKQNKNFCNELMEQAHRVLITITGVYVKSDTGGDLAPSVLNHIANFTQKALTNVHTIKITNIITEVKEMQEHVQARHQEVLDIIETFSISDSASSISQVYSHVYASSTSISMLPAEPKIFHGRDNEIADILKLFEGKSPRIAILGAGGMGKTSLSKAVLHHSDIATKYHANRFVIACDGSTNKVELANIIGAHLDLNPGKDVTQGVLRRLSNTLPTLLVLDNLETLWDPAESRKEIEEFLSLLTDIPSLALMVLDHNARCRETIPSEVDLAFLIAIATIGIRGCPKDVL
ncbi:hypothetical protein B0H16DRAFT_1830214 [Mycena metata]|uniref:Novel STAND NTPase 1 domain-containing protein n=1 Tax=Mycena metata TaxID=1033252 RepID=A0AAD7K9L0_9AGAR|nr:hypothetical protein B0H16DRAFT_1830214 [Mycena metata]